MRLVAIGGVVTLLAVVGARATFGVDGPYREYCDTLSVSPDERFQLETWQATSLDPMPRGVDVFGRGCHGAGWLVLRDRSTGERVTDHAEQALWRFVGYGDFESDDVVWEPRAVTIGNERYASSTLQLPSSAASIAIDGGQGVQ